MVKLTVKLLDAGTTRYYYGSEQQAENTLRSLFPRETENEPRLMGCVKAINDEGFAEVEVEPYQTRTRALFPEGYANQDQGDDPWPREADRK